MEKKLINKIFISKNRDYIVIPINTYKLSYNGELKEVYIAKVLKPKNYSIPKGRKLNDDDYGLFSEKELLDNRKYNELIYKKTNNWKDQ